MGECGRKVNRARELPRAAENPERIIFSFPIMGQIFTERDSA